jgi:GNAT superfamily N-acetyltransferase
MPPCPRALYSEENVPIRVEIRDLEMEETAPAAALLARAMRDNPLHVRAFGPEPGGRETSLAVLFDSALRQSRPKGAILGAFGEDEGLVGVCAFIAPYRCQASKREKLTLAPDLLAGLGIGGAARLVRWVTAWSRHDPAEPHWHFGPVGVERHLQGKGVGSALLEAFCLRMDRSRSTAYLETDKEENVSWYRRFGFRLCAQDEVLGVPNWFMLRPQEARASTVVRQPPSSARERG